MKKKIALLVVRKNYREIDWILPLLYKISNKFKIITFFQNKSVLKNFHQENISLYLKWKKINSFYFYPSFKYLFFNKLLNIITLNNTYFSRIVNEFFRKQIYSKEYLNQLLLKKNFNDYKVEIIFHEISKNSSWINSFINDKKIKIVRFPDSTVPRGNYKVDKINYKTRKF